MELRHVVTCFLVHPDGLVLLGRRSQEVHTYPGRWAAVSGSVEEGTPLRQAYREIHEETGLAEQDVELAAEGRPVRFADWELGTVWVVHPFRFRCRRPDRVRRDWEHFELSWRHPSEIADLATVPRLAEAWRNVEGLDGRPRPDAVFEQVAHDREHGAHELGIWTLEGLREALREGRDQAAACRQALDLRPSMASVRSAALDAFAVARQCGDADELNERLDGLIRTRERAPLEAAARAAELVPDGGEAVTISCSSTVLYALRDAADRIARLTAAESRPACEGRRTARLAASFGIETALVTDAAAAGSLRRADLLLFGADSLAADGSVVNKTGTLALSAAAARFGAETVCVATTDKVLPEGVDPQMEQMDPDEVAPAIEGVRVRNVYFERVPADWVDRVVTEDGPADRKRLSRRAQELRRLQDQLT